MVCGSLNFCHVVRNIFSLSFFFHPIDNRLSCFHHQFDYLLTVLFCNLFKLPVEAISPTGEEKISVLSPSVFLSNIFMDKFFLDIHRVVIIYCSFDCRFCIRVANVQPRRYPSISKDSHLSVTLSVTKYG